MSSSSTSGLDPRARHKHVLGGLHRIHWAVVLASLVLTIVASWITAENAENRHYVEFHQEAKQAVGLVLERMEKYEGGLWAGVSLVQSFAGRQVEMDRSDWQRFAKSIDLPGRYPGINGIGVIIHVEDEHLDSYVEKYQAQYPKVKGFSSHPVVTSKDHFLITYIEPLQGNIQALGLDVAFEKERRDGAMRAIRTGTAQVSGPIVLVQDAGKTPGFLFYAPFFYDGDGSRTLDGLKGMVYAPFVVKQLMAGTLHREARSVSMTIRDGDVVLYDESTEYSEGQDPTFVLNESVQLYGRTWEFEIRPTEAIATGLANTQAATILGCGLTVDMLLLGIFVLLSRSRYQAEELAEARTLELSNAVSSLESVNAQLAQSNGDLEQFAFIASHDLQAPMRTVGNFAQVLKEDLDGRISPEEKGILDTMIRATDRMKTLILSVLKFATITTDTEPARTDLNALAKDVAWELGSDVAATGAELIVGDLPAVALSSDGLALVFRNLIGNSLKFRRPGVAARIRIEADCQGDFLRLTFADNGIGIPSEHQEKVFQVFKRLHREDEYEGSGIGLSVCKRVVTQAGGTISAHVNREGGTTISIILPAALEISSESSEQPVVAGPQA